MTFAQVRKFPRAHISSQVARAFRDTWDGLVVRRDLAASPVPHLVGAGIAARSTDPARRPPEQAAAVQDELIEEFLGASAYLFTVPMYNLTMPSVFKAWLDQVIVKDRTFGLADGPAASGRPALVISARGGGYGPGTPNHGKDFVVPALETILHDMLGLEVTSLTPELTMAPVVPALTHLVPLHEASLVDAHQQARRQAGKFRGRVAA